MRHVMIRRPRSDKTSQSIECTVDGIVGARSSGIRDRSSQVHMSLRRFYERVRRIDAHGLVNVVLRKLDIACFKLEASSLKPEVIVLVEVFLEILIHAARGFHPVQDAK